MSHCATILAQNVSRLRLRNATSRHKLQSLHTLSSLYLQLWNCSTPPLLKTSDTVRYFFEIGALFNNAVSFAGAVIASESAGGKKWTCEDVYAGQLDWTSSCHNALDTRGQNVIQASSQYSMTFARFASGQTSLFIVLRTRNWIHGSPIGVSCGEKLVGAPGKMTVVTGGTMLPCLSPTHRRALFLGVQEL